MDFKNDIDLCGNNLLNGGNLEGTATKVSNPLIIKFDNGVDPDIEYDGSTEKEINVPTIRGAQGIQGTQGIQGVQGIQGFIGYIGLQGIQGSVGEKGPQGDQGIKGPQGDQGAQGISGTQGIQGLQGMKGWRGDPGEVVQGIQGIQGIQGLDGPQGPDGDPGITEPDKYTWEKIRQLFAANGILLGNGYIACTTYNGAQGLCIDSHTDYGTSPNISELQGLIPEGYGDYIKLEIIGSTIKVSAEFNGIAWESIEYPFTALLRGEYEGTVEDTLMEFSVGSSLIRALPELVQFTIIEVTPPNINGVEVEY